MIRCGDDDRVFRCIDSIDEEVDVVVSISENRSLQRRLEDRGVRFCLSPRRNLSKTSNMGFEEAKHDKVFITDSDTILERGCLARVYKALDKAPVVRAKLKFRHNSDVFLSRIVAEARDYVNSMPLAFTPGLGVQRELLPRIGRFLFNDQVPYAVDADLDYRIKNSNVPVVFLEDAILYHDVESVKHDLKAAYRIGKGCIISASWLSSTGRFYGSKYQIVKQLKAVKMKHWRDIVVRKGLFVLLYQFLWDMSFFTGRNIQWLLQTLGVARNVS